MNEQEISWALVVAVITATASLLAAFAAWRSSQSASNAIIGAREAETRALRKELAAISQRNIAEAARVNRLCDEIKILYEANAAFSGRTIMGRLKLLYDRVEQQRTEVAASIASCESKFDDEESINTIPIQDVAELVISFTIVLERISGIRRMLIDEKQELESNVRLYQAQAIKK